MQGTDWSDLQVFLAIARAGQMARAGAALGIDPTTTSRRLRRLEARLGATLFEQTREGQVMTEAGEALMVKVEAMAQAAMAIGEPSRPRVAGQLTGTLRISASEGFGSWFLAAHVPGTIVALVHIYVPFMVLTLTGVIGRIDERIQAFLELRAHRDDHVAAGGETDDADRAGEEREDANEGEPRQPALAVAGAR